MQTGDIECLSARGFSSCGRRANGRWTDFSPPFSACCGAVRFNGGTVDQHPRRRPTSLSQCAKQIDPHALRGPAHISIIGCLPRAIFRGRIDPRAPDFRTCIMPLITRRSSTRALPRVSVGRCGLIFENCAFVSQNWSRLIYASFSEAVKHATTFVPTLLWVQTLRLDTYVMIRNVNRGSIGSPYLSELRFLTEAASPAC